ncbi:MAG: HDOD domain-containing protein [Azoarcus sp.]|jgi:HD-like signal output (HDOD) protein|nr:HDOD domain-containing protein [Azoarcus sp.]
MNITDHKTLLQGITIPPCPAILDRLMAEIKSPLVNNKKIAGLIKQDVGIAAAVIRTANSPLIGGRHRIASITDAVNMLGFKLIANLVNEALLKSTINTNGTPLERFWDSSRYTAIAAKRLATVVGGVNADTAYTFGLFHDCGIPLLTQRYPEYKNILREANQDTQRAFTDIEESALGTSHAILGYYLARTWGLADAVTQGILNHHDYTQLEDPRNLRSETHRLIAINVMAEIVASTHLRTVQDGEWRKAREMVSVCLGYIPTDLDDIVDDMVYQFDEALNHADN